MPFRARFDCLWCGAQWVTRGHEDLEGWAQLCPTCLGKAGSNAFLRGRLHAALAERGATQHAVDTAATAPVPGQPRAGARAAGDASATAFPDDWFLRHGAFERGAVHDAAWQAELDVVTRWLDAQPLSGRIDEPAAGVGFFSPLLAEKGELHASDLDGDALDRARDRLLAHHLRAHLHVADPWGSASTPGSGPLASAVVAAFVMGRVRGAGLDAAAMSLRRRLAPGGRLALVDLRPDPAGGPPDGIAWTWHEPAILEAAVARAGFGAIELAETGRFFVLLGADAV